MSYMGTFSEVFQVKVLTSPYAEFGRHNYDGWRTL